MSAAGNWGPDDRREFAPKISRAAFRCQLVTSLTPDACSTSCKEVSGVCCKKLILIQETSGAEKQAPSILLRTQRLEALPGDLLRFRCLPGLHLF